jgi:hypothetical protein
MHHTSCKKTKINCWWIFFVLFLDNGNTYHFDLVKQQLLSTNCLYPILEEDKITSW